jgi:NADH dehydrogenase FAD-containing subunit
VVVGAGFSGVETIAEVRELVRRALNITTTFVRRICFSLIEYAPRILPSFLPTSRPTRRSGSRYTASRC